MSTARDIPEAVTRAQVAASDPDVSAWVAANAGSGKTQSWVLDCSNPNKAPDLWLRDGDVVEVPEK